MRLLIGLCFALGWLVLWTCAVAESRPNVVVIFIDDMGFADRGCFGNPLIKTPHIDQLAEEGIKLTNFYVNSPICSASRVALTTGQYQGRWKIHSFLNTRAGNANRGMADYLDSDAPTTAKKLRAAGYATAHFGKWHMGGGQDVDDAPLPQAYGFDESLVSFEGLGDRLISNERGVERARELGRGRVIPCKRWERIQMQANRTIDFIRRHRDQPFYVRLFPNDVHDRHDPIPGTAAKFASVTDDRFVQNFLAVLEDMDRHLGRVIDEIDRLGLGEKTLILFTSDNGPTDWPRKYLTGTPAGYTGPFHGRKWSLYEGGIRMPFIARWTGTIPAGREDTTSVVSAIDLSPTICQLVGVSVEASLDGLDRSGVLLGRASKRSKPVFWQYGHPHAILKGGKPEHQSPTFAIRDGRWKFLVNPDGSEAQLFDLLEDPSERSNLVATKSELAKGMARQIDVWAKEIGFEFQAERGLEVPKPTIAVLASNQLLRFVNRGVRGDRERLDFDGQSWLDLPKFRVPRVAGGRNLLIQGSVDPEGADGVILAHGGSVNGYSLYLDEGHMVFAACGGGERAVLRSAEVIRGVTKFDARWNADGRMSLKVNGKLVGGLKTGFLIDEEPLDSMQIGSDLGEPVGIYSGPNAFTGRLFDLTFRYPNGT